MGYSITDSEWKIMQCLWAGGALPLGEIIEQVTPTTGWSGNTIRTLLVRLVEKGAVSAVKEGRNYRYSALAKESECALQETEQFLQRVFDGSPSKLFAALTGGGKLSDKDCDEIEALIRQMRGRD